MKTTYFLFLIGFLFYSCNSSENQPDNSSKTPVKSINYSDSFNEYWYAGKAEVSSYTLNQARYGEMREGNATLIFVTEPFSKKKQVKLDNPKSAGDDKATVMKLNFVKKFDTGIYPYSMMLSTFTPVDQYNFDRSLKVTMSGQEWCGQVYAQLNLDNESYKVNSYSYFESEGDKQFEIKATLLEDEVWNLIRLDPASLPTGDVKITPGLFVTRLMHKPLKPLNTKATLEKSGDNSTYTLAFENERTLAITFESVFPHKIVSWKETYKSFDGKMMTTTGSIKETLLIDYWNKNSNSDSYLRDSLQLP
ncbi:hypothetical protein E1176_10725 [Fulvivirga sp. RKSG066]|uniref:hypothetical protein n=1 Tax=Fulvivirga aurantia TaxID=2529383 RepID=UPI0012BD6F96|nr:hypothetical protein [Fulvivirga aurantia]MTI21492.1 hypothetical protein [Fulvivirga aurantia]